LTGVVDSLTVSPNDSGCAPHTVNFNNTSLAGLSYLWDFGDGNTSNLASPTHTYTTAGIFNVTLIAYNPNGCINADTAYTSIKVIAAVDASFSLTTVLDCIDDTVHFTLNNPNPGNVLYNWDFGDGTGSSALNPTHVYTTQGIYTVTCYAANSFCFDTVQTVINLNHPIASVFSTPDSICLGVQTILSSNSTPLGFITHDWNMGNGVNINSGINPIQPYTYPASGVYTITLVITDTLGCKDTSSQSIFVDQPGFVDFTVSDSTI
jgi:PKD repeat protein